MFIILPMSVILLLGCCSLEFLLISEKGALVVQLVALALTLISATPCLTSYTTFSEATARSAGTAKLSSEALSG